MDVSKLARVDKHFHLSYLLVISTPKRFTSYVRHASSLAIKISNEALNCFFNCNQKRGEKKPLLMPLSIFTSIHLHLPLPSLHYLRSRHHRTSLHIEAWSIFKKLFQQLNNPLSSPPDYSAHCNRLICCGMRCYRGRVPPMKLDSNKHNVHGAFQNVRNHRSIDEWVCQGTHRVYRAASLPTLPLQRVAF